MGSQGFQLALRITKSTNFIVVDTSTADVDEAVCMDGPLPNTSGIALVEECADLNTSVTQEEDSDDKL